jgi:hypothetical protein
VVLNVVAALRGAHVVEVLVGPVDERAEHGDELETIWQLVRVSYEFARGGGDTAGGSTPRS